MGGVNLNDLISQFIIILQRTKDIGDIYLRKNTADIIKPIAIINPLIIF